MRSPPFATPTRRKYPSNSQKIPSGSKLRSTCSPKPRRSSCIQSQPRALLSTTLLAPQQQSLVWLQCPAYPQPEDEQTPSLKIRQRRCQENIRPRSVPQPVAGFDSSTSETGKCVNKQRKYEDFGAVKNLKHGSEKNKGADPILVGQM